LTDENLKSYIPGVFFSSSLLDVSLESILGLELSLSANIEIKWFKLLFTFKYIGISLGNAHVGILTRI